MTKNQKKLSATQNQTLWDAIAAAEGLVQDTDQAITELQHVLRSAKNVTRLHARVASIQGGRFDLTDVPDEWLETASLGRLEVAISILKALRSAANQLTVIICNGYGRHH